ncbi:hypothetical protein L1987_21858 [Smallanthus sonchifolius]|uniref:Uncharacterized protein n=1 Tax=Smallanthus sonchifolius TaxID=185202 RepID=A0ACB9IF17_9ASTR|nr:hypothetical protein L1987_21858 [Smallanthus sonchifolius]
MSSTADDSHSPPADVHRSTKSLNTDEDDELEEECGDQDNGNGDTLRNPVTLPEIDYLGLGNEEAVKGGAADVTAAEKSESDLVPISPDRQEVIYDFPPGLSTLNVNGRPKFELVTVRENGRLQMFMVPNLSPQLVRSPGRNGRLKMWLLNDDQRGGGEQALPPVRRSI